MFKTKKDTKKAKAKDELKKPVKKEDPKPTPKKVKEKVKEVVDISVCTCRSDGKGGTILCKKHEYRGEK